MSILKWATARRFNYTDLLTFGLALLVFQGGTTRTTLAALGILIVGGILSVSLEQRARDV